jgi:hypothetical protein
MKRALLAAAALASAACGSNNINVGSGQFLAPTGLAEVPATDRQLIFVAGTGRDGLRALQICEAQDSSGNVVVTCDSNLQFVPGPIRVFPANVETGNRPLRLAGVHLGVAQDGGFASDGTPLDGGEPIDFGAAAVVGADQTMRIVDAQALLNAVASPGADAGVPQVVQLGGVAVDVVADNPVNPASDIIQSSTTDVSVFVATVPVGTTPGQLQRIKISLDANNHPVPTPAGSCTLDGVLPTRLALAPNEIPAFDLIQPNCQSDGTGCLPNPTNDIFVADGAGDGVVRVARSSLDVGGTCSMTRVSAGGRSVKSLALSPQWYEATDAGTNPYKVHPAGELLMMNLEPSSTTPAGTIPDPGGVIFANLCTYDANQDCQAFDGGTIIPIPPFRFDGTGPNTAKAADGGTATSEPMEPISPMAGLPSEVTFLVPPRPDVCPPPCSQVYVGAPSNTPIQSFPLVAALTNSDGATYFIDVLGRRFVNANFFNLPTSPVVMEPLLSVAQTFSPATADPNGPFFAFEAADVNHPLDGWFQPGVSHTATWRATWHSIFPTLSERGGTVTPSGTGTLFFDAPGDFSVIQNDPVLHFGPGDAASFSAYSLAKDSSPACQSLVSLEGSQPLRFETTVVSIGPSPTPGMTRLQLEVPASANFNLGTCTAFGAVAQFHTAGDKPWLVFNNFTAVQRIANGEVFVGRERRFDYPYDYTPLSPFPELNAPPTRSTNDSVAFHIFGDEPTIPGSQWTFAVVSENAPIFYADNALSSGYATGLVSFTNPVFRNMLFTAVTGNDSLIMAVPEILSTDISGLQIFR